jgi:CheY-like chemotaxis protein
VAYSITRRHDGDIRVESTPGAGATFHVLLPAAARAPAQTPEPPARRFSGRGRVLVMDDDDGARDVAVRLFQALGFEVTWTSNGAEAIRRHAAARAAGTPFALVFLDLTVPGGMGGMECLAHLRAADPAVRVIVSSGYSTASVMAQPERHGAAGVLAKPYRLEDLEAVLRKL